MHHRTCNAHLERLLYVTCFVTAKSGIAPLLGIALAFSCCTYNSLALFEFGVTLFRVEIHIRIIYCSHSLHFFLIVLLIRLFAFVGLL